MITGVGIPTAHSTAIEQGDPEHPFTVDRHAIRQAVPTGGNANANLSLIQQIPLSRERKAPDLQGGGINEIHRATVMAPGQAVGDADTAEHPLGLKRGINTPEGSAAISKVVGHGAGPETTPGVTFAVIESVAWQMALRVMHRCQRPRAGIQALKAVSGGQQQIITQGGHDTAAMNRQGQHAVEPRRGIKQPNLGVVDIHPQQQLLLHPPMGSLTQNRGSFEHAGGLVTAQGGEHHRHTPHWGPSPVWPARLRQNRAVP